MQWNKRRFVIDKIKTVVSKEIVNETDIITKFRNLEYSKYENYKFNNVIQELQEFLISQNLLPDNTNSADGKWGNKTRNAYETYMNKPKPKAEQNINIKEVKN